MKKLISMKKGAYVLAAFMVLTSAVSSFGMMIGGGMMGGGTMMTNTGGFGMMNGMAGSPVVDANGTAYITSIVPLDTLSTMPTYNAFASQLLSVNTSGQTIKMSVSGLLSRPVIEGSVLISTVSLPKMSDYSIIANEGTTTLQSVVFWLQLPLTLSSVPTGVRMDGRFASSPVVAKNMVYVTTTNFGNGMMQGTDVFNDRFPNYTVGNTARSYLYIFNMDGTLVTRTVIR